MINNFPNETTYRIWKLLEFHAKNNIKSPLGLYSLLIACDPAIELEQDKTQNKAQQEQFEM
jgi:hypothetical protein